MVIRVNKTKNYTVMSNVHLRDKNLSLKAKGLLSLMLSLPEEWDYSIAGLVAICKESETAIKSTLDELKQYGYLIITKKLPNQTASGRFEYEYDIYEQPQEKQAVEEQGVEKQGVENQPLEILTVENHGQLNTKEINTDNEILNNNITNKQKENATALQSNDIEREFENLWSLYPRKQGKSSALKAYAKARKGNPDVVDAVTTGIQAYVAYIDAKKIEPRYIKQGSTWFNQHCWEDDYTIGDGKHGHGQYAKPFEDSTEKWGVFGLNL